MDEKDRRSSSRRADDQPRKVTAADAASRTSTTLWRMRSATYDNQASCSVIEGGRRGCDVLVLFTQGLGVPEHFDDVASALRHAMEIAGRLTAQGWVDVDLADE